MNQRRAGPFLALTVVGLGMLLGGYLGSYYAMLLGARLDESGPRYTQPIYRAAPQFCEIVFTPAHECDRLLRRDYWSGKHFNWE